MHFSLVQARILIKPHPCDMKSPKLYRWRFAHGSDNKDCFASFPQAPYKCINSVIT